MRADLMSREPVRILLGGFPGTGKTGCLAALANAGYKLRILDFDGNPESLVAHTKLECLSNVDIVSFEDDIVRGAETLEVKGVPRAFDGAFRALSHWRYPVPEGTVDAQQDKGGKWWVDLGPTKDWGPDHVMVLDGLTGHTNAAWTHALNLLGKTNLNSTRQVWGLAADEQFMFIKEMTKVANKHHTIVITHLKIIGPEEIERTDDSVTRRAKEEAAEIDVPTRWYPTAVGRQLAKTIAGEFPTFVRAMSERSGRSLHYLPAKDIDLKLPVADPARLGKLSISDGMLKIFEALGHAR